MIMFNIARENEEKKFIKIKNGVLNYNKSLLLLLFLHQEDVKNKIVVGQNESRKILLR